MTKIPNTMCLELTAAHIISGDRFIMACDDECGKYNLCHGITNGQQTKVRDVRNREKTD